MSTLLHKMTKATKDIPLSARISFLLLLVVALLYSPALKFEFLNYDDDMHVYENQLVTRFVPAKLTRVWGGSVQGLYIPVTYTLWGMLGRLSAWLHPANPTIMDPAVFHAANIILHAVAVLVVYAILKLLLKQDWPAAGGALLFALHPVQVATVTWVSEMKGELSGFLGLLAIWQYLRYAATNRPLRPRLHGRYLAATFFFLAAILAKPSVVIIPLLAATLAILLMKRDWRQVTMDLSPWLLLAIPLIIVTKEVQPSEELLFLPNLWQRFLVAGDAITFYLGKLMWPFGLGPDYGRTPQKVLGSSWVYLSGLLPYALAALLLWRIRRPWLVTGAALFTAALLPVLGFIPFMFQAISTVADRYLYLAMLAPALLLGRFLCLFPGRRTTATAAILFMFLAIRSEACLSYWRDSLTFNQQALVINPQSALAYNNLGVAYKELRQPQQAIAAFKQAIANAHGHTPAYANLGNIYAETGYPEEAKTYYLKDLQLKPYSPKVNLMLGALANQNGKPFEALAYYRKAQELDPEFAPTYVYLGLLETQLGQFDEAIASYRRASELDPYHPEALNNLGLLYELTNRKQPAIEAYRRAILLTPTAPDAFNNLGRLLLDEGLPEEALPLLLQATKLAPEQLNPANNLALTYLRLGRAREAAVWFRRVLSLDPNFPSARENITKAEALDKRAPTRNFASPPPPTSEVHHRTAPEDTSNE